MGSQFDAIENSYLSKINLNAEAYRELFEKGLKLIENEPQSQKLLIEILEDYQKRLEEMPAVDLSLNRLEQYDDEVKERIKSLILFGTQAVLIRENSKIQEHLKELNQKYKDVLSVVTHEFKNSLTSIYGYNRIVKKRLEQKRYDNLIPLIDNIDRLTKNLFAMVDTLLNMFLIEEGKIRLEYQLFDLVEDVLNPLISEYASTLEQQKRQVVINKKDEKYILYADLHLMQVVFRNLLLNAIQYGKPETDIEISIFKEDSWLKVHIKNYGEGVPPEQLPFIFEKFARFHRSKGQRNVGLGLYTVKNIIELHNGSIEAKSKPEEWIEFIIRLPNQYSSKKAES